jgi:hypothetical protein
MFGLLFIIFFVIYGSFITFSDGKKHYEKMVKRYGIDFISAKITEESELYQDQ